MFLSKTIHNFKLLYYNECVKNDFMAELLKPGTINMSVYCVQLYYNHELTTKPFLNCFRKQV